MRSKPAILVTADGASFRGRSLGAEGVAIGEAVFNTSMTGYQEVLTDPSYAGQVVVMTTPHIGNYGVTADDEQASAPHLSGFVVRSNSRRASSWRSEGSLTDYLHGHSLVAISDVDTRRLTRHIRNAGAMPVAMGTDVDESELAAVAAAAPEMTGQDLAGEVSTSASYDIATEGETLGRIVAVDLGIKRDIVRSLVALGYDVTVVPYRTTAEEILSLEPTGVFLSNGPGDPEPLQETVRAVRGVLGKVPLFGICLGHQVFGLAVGATTYKLPFGHHGGNHPVRRMDDGRVEITSQNHGFAVDLWSMTDESPPEREGLVDESLLPRSVATEFGEVVPTHQNLNDGTIEGMRLTDVDAFSVQYHPEAAPGPRDAAPLFEEFHTMIQESR